MRTEAERAAARERQRRKRARDRHLLESALEVVEYLLHRFPIETIKAIRDVDAERESRLLEEHSSLLHADLRQRKKGNG